MKIENEQQIKEMLVQVGHALFSSQLMEKELAFLLLLPETQKRGIKPTSKEFADVIEKLNKMTFGVLINKLKENFNLNEFAAKQLEEALNKRIFLAHHFFDSHQGKLDDANELHIMKNELTEMIALFSSIFDVLKKRV